MNASKLIHLVLIAFTSLTLTHAGFVDYRSGATEIRALQTLQPSSTFVPDGNNSNNNLYATQQQIHRPFYYLQSRKLIELHDILGNLSDACRRRAHTSIWRGLIRMEWTRNGLCCGVFDLLVKMNGGKTRIKLLQSLSLPRNKLQLSRDVGIDWKAVDKHIDRLLSYGLITELAFAGTCRVFTITEKGRRALLLAERENGDIKAETQNNRSEPARYTSIP